MPTRTRIRTLPEPTWTQSDNDLLPKWLKYLEWHARHEGTDELGRLQRLVHETEQSIEICTQQVKEYSVELKRLNAMLTELKNRPKISDEDVKAIEPMDDAGDVPMDP